MNLEHLKNFLMLLTFSYNYYIIIINFMFILLRNEDVNGKRGFVN